MHSRLKCKDSNMRYVYNIGLPIQPTKLICCQYMKWNMTDSACSAVDTQTEHWDPGDESREWHKVTFRISKNGLKMF